MTESKAVRREFSNEQRLSEQGKPQETIMEGPGESETPNKEDDGMIYTMRGKPIPTITRVQTNTGTVWHAITDGMGGYYHPDRSAWVPTPYTFASARAARAALKRIIST